MAELIVPFLLALLPILWLVVALIALKFPAWKAAICSFAIACVLAFAYWHMPVGQVATASIEGWLMALWPIVLVIIAAVFTYNLCVHTGAMDTISSMITSLSSDRRVLALLVAFVGGLVQGAKPREMVQVLGATVKQMLPTAITMLAVLGCAKVMGYSGMIGAISAFCIAVAGALFPLVAPVIGCIGAFVTGSGTSSGLLFGSVQLQAADALHLDPYWIVALNSLGVGAGKMISPQTLAIGMAAVQVVGAEGKLLNRVLPYAIGFLVLMAGLGMVGAMVF